MGEYCQPILLGSYKIMYFSAMSVQLKNDLSTLSFVFNVIVQTFLILNMLKGNKE